MAVLPVSESNSSHPPGVGRGPSFTLGDDLDLRRLLLELHDDHLVEDGSAHRALRARFFEVLAALGHLAGGDRIETVLEAACGLIAETLSVDAVLLLEPGGATDRLVVRAAAGRLAGALGEELDCGAGTQAGLALAQRVATATADAQATGPADAFLARHGLASSALVALPGQTGPRRLVGAFEAERRTFEPDELGFLQAAGGVLAVALARLRSEQERQRLQQRLVDVGRLVSLGTLAGGVAHELNNPLSYVTANLAFITEEAAALARRLEASGPQDPELAESARQVIDAAADTRDGIETMRGLVRDLQTLARGDETALRSLDLTAALESSINLARSETKHRARVERALAAVLPPIRANEARLGQVFLSLLVCAARGLPEGHADEHLIRIGTSLAEGDRVAVEVSDSGAGIPADQLARLLDPAGGAEPSLALCRGVVEGLGGELQVESRPGRGTTYRVLFPVVPVEPAEPHPEAAAAPRRARILVVDDEPMVGNVLERTLGEEFEIVPVDGSRAALELLKRGETFDVILSDLLMPDMSGMELFREVERLAPALAARMVFLSGGAFTLATREFLARPGVECIEKPFDLATVRGAIARRMAPGR